MRDILSEFMVATVLGMISPKIRMTIVNIPVAIPTAVAPLMPAPIERASFVASMVVREEAERFTILLPIKTALKSLPGFSMSRLTVLAVLFPSSSRLRIRILLTVVSAVSADEKKADNSTRIKRIMSCVTASASKKNHLLKNLLIKCITSILS